MEQVNIGDELLVKAPFHEDTNETWNVIVVGISKNSDYPFRIEVQGERDGLRRDFEMKEEVIIKIIKEEPVDA